MLRVMIHCPQTGKLVFSGVYLDEAYNRAGNMTGNKEDAFARQNAVGCPHCGDLHVWQPEEVELEVQSAAKTAAARDHVAGR